MSCLEIVIGCMFSGKSTELIRRCNRYKAIGHSILYINHSNDTRTTDFIQTHNKNKEKAIKLNTLMPFLESIEYTTSSVIGIDEAQFFPDLYEFVVASEKKNKKIIIAGLDGDFNRKPFGKILECIPLCDEIVKLTALDKDGTPAIFTKRINDANQEQVCVGAANLYQAVSRKHYLE